MNQYEVMYVIDTALEEQARTDLINRFSGLVELNGGQVDRVDTLGGITFATKLGYGYSMGVSLGTFVDLWAGPWMRGEGEAYILGNQICMHEFGHTADSQLFGWFYLPLIGLPSLLSALGKGDHNVFWTEIRANSHAKRYFSKYYSIVWKEEGYPTQTGLA